MFDVGIVVRVHKGAARVSTMVGMNHATMEDRTERRVWYRSTEPTPSELLSSLCMRGKALGLKFRNDRNNSQYLQGLRKIYAIVVLGYRNECVSIIALEFDDRMTELTVMNMAGLPKTKTFASVIL